MKAVAFRVGSVVILGVGVWGVKAWIGHVKGERFDSLLSSIEHLDVSGDSESALDLLEENIALLKSSENRKRRTELVELELATATRDLSRLASLENGNPDLVASDERASLLWGRICLHSRKFDQFEKVREVWSGRETDEAAWLFLDTNRLLILNDYAAAEALVNGARFEGEEEAKRLVYLALFNSDETSKAGSLLAEAYRQDPSNTDVRTFAANLYESAGDFESAQREYVAAYVIAPENPVTRDNLAEFYRRRGNISQALDTWDDVGDEPAPAFVWVKLFFWSKMCSSPRDTPVQIETAPLAEWIDAAAALRPDQFWSPELERITSGLGAEARGEEKYFFWLKLVDHLVHDRTEEALSLFRRAPVSAKGLAPQLASALYVVLVYQSTGALLDRSAEIYDPGAGYSHPFFEKLATAFGVEATELNEPFFGGRNAIASAFLAATWLNAACCLSGESSGREPAWFEFGIAQAYRYSKGNAAAISYLEPIPPSVATSALLGELYLGENMIEKGVLQLESVAGEQSDSGLRATWLLGLTYLATGRLDDAEAMVRAHPSFGGSQVGIEMRARIALARNDRPNARSLYRRIVRSSLEAKMFFSREAYAKEEWAEARRFTEEAIELEPNNGKLLENLAQIQVASGAAKR